MDPLAGLFQAEDEDVGGGSLDGRQGLHGGRLEEHQLGVRRPALDAANDDALGGGHRGTPLLLSLTAIEQKRRVLCSVSMVE